MQHDFDWLTPEILYEWNHLRIRAGVLEITMKEAREYLNTFNVQEIFAVKEIFGISSKGAI